MHSCFVQNLQTLQFQTSVKELTIDKYAFSGCTKPYELYNSKQCQRVNYRQICVQWVYKTYELYNSKQCQRVNYRREWRSGSARSLKDFTISGNVEKLNIGEKAFGGCTNLTNFTIPDSVEKLTIYGGCVLWLCTSLTRL